MTDIKLTDELFADLMDKIARERAIQSAMEGRKFLLFSSPKQFADLIEMELDNQYESMMKTVNSEITIKYHLGSHLLVDLWNSRFDLYDEALEILDNFNPKAFKTFDEYIMYLVNEKRLERIILLLAEIKDLKIGFD